MNLVTPPRIVKTAVARFTMRLHLLSAAYTSMAASLPLEDGEGSSLDQAHAQDVGEVHAGGLVGEMWEPQFD
jgi:hypothetical protein